MKTTSSTSNKKKPTWNPQLETIEIIDAIKTDHEDLRKLIEVMKSEDAGRSEKKKAFMQFAVLLKSHAVSEERAFYARALKNKELKINAHEGYVEHKVADLLSQVARREKMPDRLEAEMKVLAELVEHHIEEEESDFLPEAKKEFSEEERNEMGRNFLQFRKRSQKKASSGNAGVLEQHLH